MFTQFLFDCLLVFGAAGIRCTISVHINFSNEWCHWTAICQQPLIVVAFAAIVVMFILWRKFVLITVCLCWLWIVWKFFIHLIMATCIGAFRLSLEHAIYFQDCLVNRSMASGCGSWGRCAASTWGIAAIVERGKIAAVTFTMQTEVGRTEMPLHNVMLSGTNDIFVFFVYFQLHMRIVSFIVRRLHHSNPQANKCTHAHTTIHPYACTLLTSLQ